jgi:hypothetical protein
VHQHRAEIVDVDLPGGGRNVGHRVLPPVRDEGCHEERNAPHERTWRTGIASLRHPESAAPAFRCI